MDRSEPSEAQEECEPSRCERERLSHSTVERQCLWRLGEKIIECLDAIVALLFSIRTRSRWATVREAERYAHVSNGVVRDAVNNGELPAYRRSAKSTVIVDLDEIDVWIHTTWRICVTEDREESVA